MLTNNYFNLYLQQVWQLAETIVIKSDYSAKGINQHIVDSLGEAYVDYSKPETWKYYMNLAGEYHPLDDRLQITSLDTIEPIEFNKANLRLHRATRRAYEYGSVLYKELVAKHPRQEQLILGILYPCDINKAIAAKDGTILSYPTKLVDVNEYSFINKLQQWIYDYKRQFTNPQYNISDELTEAVVLSQMYIHLVPAILEIRLRACKTNEAHSYHVRSYLASHGFLNEYLDHLTTRQALWFYRNINYIERYVGHRDTFNWLIENVLTDRDIPLGEYNFYHDLYYQPNGIEEFDTKLIADKTTYYPTVAFKKQDLNAVTPVTKKGQYSLAELLDKEDDLAVDNAKYRPVALLEGTNLFKHSLDNRLKTKVLESSMYDYTDSFKHKLAEVLLNEWCVTAHEGRYRAFITAINPVTNERIPLNSLDALYLLWYCYRKSEDIELKFIPDFTADRVARYPIPKEADLRKHIPNTHSKTHVALDYRLDVVTDNTVKVATELMPLQETVYSIDAFYEYAYDLWRRANQQDHLIYLYEHAKERAYAENLINRFWCVKIFRNNLKAKKQTQYLPGFKEDVAGSIQTVTLPYVTRYDGLSYSEFLSSRNINVSKFKREHYKTLYEQLLLDGTGASLNSELSLRALQRAMLKLMTQLGSYSVQYITEINDNPILQVRFPRIRIGEQYATTLGKEYVTELEVGVQDIKTTVVQSVDYDSNHIDTNDTVDISVVQRVDCKLPSLIGFDDKLIFRQTFWIPIPRIHFHYDYDYYPNEFGLPPIWRNQDGLSIEHIESSYELVDVEQHDLGCSIRTEEYIIPINENRLLPYLPGFKEDLPELWVNNTNPYLPGYKEDLPYIWVNNTNPYLPGYKEDLPTIDINLPEPYLPGYLEDKPELSYVTYPYLPGFEEDNLVDINSLINVNKHAGIRHNADELLVDRLDSNLGEIE